VRPLASRRTMADPRGRLADWRATMRAAMRRGGEVQLLATRRRRTRWPNLVVLCDISGSMSQYSRMVLHFVHAVANHKGAGWARVHAFTFGTRLTNITHHLRERDVDAALAAAGAEAQDWQGGTRIGTCLHAFNRDWSRRVMGQGAVVLLISDGLDRDPPEALGREMERLQLSSRRLLWVNPLLRWDGFVPKARGIAAMLPHVDCFRSGHSIQSLADLAEAVARPEDAGEKLRLMRLLAGREHRLDIASRLPRGAGWEPEPAPACWEPNRCAQSREGEPDAEKSEHFDGAHREPVASCRRARLSAGIGAGRHPHDLRRRQRPALP